MKTNDTLFFCYKQNNSGGHFDYDEGKGIGCYVIIEAFNAEHANQRAERIGLYFGGCNSGTDCSCCGDRWYSVEDDDGKLEPMIYGEPVKDHRPLGWLIRDHECAFIHYLNEGIEHVPFKEVKTLKEMNQETI